MAKYSGASMNAKNMKWIWLNLVLLVVLSGAAMSANITTTLPGYPGELPFGLETGYVGVGDLDELQLFYYFIESGRDPVRDPLLLWLTGGPGCSGLSGLVYEIGPFTFDFIGFNGSFPTLVDNPFSWTQIASIIFLDAPVGTGFSYSTTQEGYNSSDTESSEAIYQFLRKWMIAHPKFRNNPLYISGDSYSGIIVPQVTLKVSNGNLNGVRPHMNLQGYVLGNPVTELHNDENSRMEFYHRVTLISSELYASIKVDCEGEYVTPNASNADCMDDIGIVAECTIHVDDAHILQPKCSWASPKVVDGIKRGSKFFDDIPEEIIRSPTKRQENWCRNHNYVLSYIWANDQAVQSALSIRNGTIADWKRCNKSLAYDENVLTVIPYHAELIGRGFRSLIYSGDHDGLIPYVGTLSWIGSLNLSTIDGWRPYYVNGQVAGFTQKYTNIEVSEGLTFATIKNGGHTAPEYMPEQALEMMDRWLSYYSL